MIKANTIVHVQTQLVLDETEREWLHAVMQNHFLPGDESEHDACMREMFFNATAPKVD